MKKTLIRTLTFICGLYFFLEFFLPEEIGGDFDKGGVRTPSLVPAQESGTYRMYYVGEFDMRNQAVGLAEISADGQVKRSESNPVLRSTLFNSTDRLGFRSVTVIRSGGGFLMFYLGQDLDRHETICWAKSEDGINWEKQGRAIFRDETPWRQYYETEESYQRQRFAKLNSLAALEHEGVVSLVIAVMTTEGKSELRTARYDPASAKFTLDPELIPLGPELEAEMVRSICIVPDNGSPEMWLLLAEGQLYRTSLAAGSEMEPVAFAVDEEEKLSEFAVMKTATGYRAYYTVLDSGGYLVNGIFFSESTDSRDWPGHDELNTVLEKGEGGQSTYLTRGSVFANDCLMIIGSFAIFLGVINMCLVHGKNLMRTRKEVHNSAIFFVCLVIMFVFTLLGKPAGETMEAEKMTVLNSLATELRTEAETILDDVESMENWISKGTVVDMAAAHVNPMLAPVLLGRTQHLEAALREMEETAPARAEALMRKARSIKHYAKKDVAKVIEGKAEMEGIEAPESHKEYSTARVYQAAGYDFIFKFFVQSLGTSVFALISFYMVGAAFRSFRIKSVEALLLIISAVIVLLGQIPIGNMLLPHSLIPRAGQKLLLVVNAAAYRGVLLGMTIGALSMSLRLWFGLERGMFHGTE